MKPKSGKLYRFKCDMVVGNNSQDQYFILKGSIVMLIDCNIRPYGDYLFSFLNEDGKISTLCYYNPLTYIEEL